MKRDTSLSPRVENARSQRQSVLPIQFSLEEIRSHFDEGMEAVKAQFDVTNRLCECDLEICKTIWRSQVVLAEGLLDFYIHEISKFAMCRMLCGDWEKSEKYPNFMVPMSKVEDAIKAEDSNDWFFEYINERFSREVFLSQESMKDQLNLIGIGFSETMRRLVPQHSDKDASEKGKTIVRELFERRNEIAHQNDRRHADAEQNDITKEFVVNYIGKVESIVDAIYNIADEKNRLR